MVAFTLATAAASLAALASTANAVPLAGGPPYFKVSTCSSTPNSAYSGLYLSTVHTGAGSNAVVAQPSKKDGVMFQYNGTAISEYISPDITYNLFLTNFRPVAPKKGSPSPQHTAPKGYYYVDVGVDGVSKGFSSPTDGGLKKPISYAGPKQNFASFAVCKVPGVAFYVGTTYQLLYRVDGAAADPSGKCEDVTLYGLFQATGTGKIPDAKKC